MWRLPLFLSLLAHAALGLALWLAPERKIAFESPPLDTQAKEKEIDFLVMDIGTPPVVRAAVAPAPKPAAPVVPAEAPTAAAFSVSLPGSPGSGVVELSRETTAFFQVPTQAKSVVYVIDRSGSMGVGGRLARARRELLASLNRLPSSARFQIIAYNRHAAPLRIDGRSELVVATPPHIEQACRLLEAIQPEGGTAHGPALEAALRLQPEAIYFLTDADDLPRELVATLTRLNRGRTVIHAIELTTAHRDRFDMPLHLLARENRGNYRGVDLTGP